MPFFDLIAGVVMIASAVQGAWRGMASQLAPIGSLVLGYMVAIPLSKDLAPWFGTEGPTNRFLAALVVYVGIAFVVHFVAGLFRGTLEQLRMESFDRHLGFLLGAAKGSVICVLMSLFGVGLSEKSRQTILASRAGEVSARVIQTLEPMVPSEIRDLLDPSFEAIASSDPEPILPPESPFRRSARAESNPRWPTTFSDSADEAASPRSEPARPRRPSAFLEEAARTIESIESRRR